MTDERRAGPADVLIIGAGIAGSMLALVLGRSGRSVTVVDPRRAPSPMFRNEKLGTAQIALLEKLKALACFETGCWPAADHPHAYPPHARPGLTDCGAPHQAWLRGVRAAWPNSVRFVEGVIDRLELSDDLQRATTAKGDALTARLAVAATGRMPALLTDLGIEHRLISPGHSVCLGVSVALTTPQPAVVVDAPPGSGVGYVSLFPMPGETRLNVFSYRALSDPWTRRMAADPLACLSELDPRLARILDGARLLRGCEARGTDLYKVHGHRQAGLVLIGDAFHAPCPASGTGMLRILNDIDRLATVHIPDWLDTPGMDRGKIDRFYADPVKRRLDAASLKSSLRGRAAVVAASPYWRLRRAAGVLKRTVLQEGRLAA